MKLQNKHLFSPAILADVAFGILIVLVSIGAVNSHQGKDAYGPAVELAPQAHPIQLKVKSDHLMLVNNREIDTSDRASVYRLILGNLENDPNQPILLTADQDVPAGDVVVALDILRTIEKDLRTTSPGFRLSLTIDTISTR